MTFSGPVQMQQNSQFGKRRRSRDTIARSVASLPKFMVPKLPKKLIFVGLCFVICVSDSPEPTAT